MFDLRHLEHSTIIYEDPQHTPLLRLAWNKQEPNLLATIAMDSCEVRGRDRGTVELYCSLLDCWSSTECKMQRFGFQGLAIFDARFGSTLPPELTCFMYGEVTIIPSYLHIPQYTPTSPALCVVLKPPSQPPSHLLCIILPR